MTHSTLGPPPIRARGFGTADAAVYLGRSQITLRRWRMTGTGPAYRLVNGRASYDLVDLDAFLNANPLVRSTSERSAIAQRTVAQSVAA